MNMPNKNKEFSEFISNENGEFRMRLATSIYVLKDGDIYRESKTGQLFLVSKTELANKAWIVKNFIRERDFQLRKRTAIFCQSGERFSKNQRIAYNNARY